MPSESLESLLSDSWSGTDSGQWFGMVLLSTSSRVSAVWSLCHSGTMSISPISVPRSSSAPAQRYH